MLNTLDVQLRTLSGSRLSKEAYAENLAKIASELMPCPFTGPKIFCAGPNILCQPKTLTAFSASS